MSTTEPFLIHEDLAYVVVKITGWDREDATELAKAILDDWHTRYGGGLVRDNEGYVDQEHVQLDQLPRNGWFCDSGTDEVIVASNMTRVELPEGSKPLFRALPIGEPS